MQWNICMATTFFVEKEKRSTDYIIIPKKKGNATDCLFPEINIPFMAMQQGRDSLNCYLLPSFQVRMVILVR